jgi:predicted metallopeptidase
MKVEFAVDVKDRIKRLIPQLGFSYIKESQIFCMRSFGSSSRARARIWSFPSIWQKALQEKPYYIIEVLAEKYDRLPETEKLKVLIHELMHIPKNFSGALLPHRGRGRVVIDAHSVNKLFNMIKK